MTKEKYASNLCTAEMPISSAMAKLEESLLKILLIVDSNQILLGVATDGDIRRYIIHGGDLSAQLSVIMNTHYKTLPPHRSIAESERYMRQHAILYLPIVDENKKLVDLDSLVHYIPKIIENPVLIMAGGEGKRMRPLTDNCPKPLLKLGDKSIMEYTFNNLISLGFHRFYFSVNYLGAQIESYFGDGSRFGVEINYLYEEQKLGTGGGLSLLDEKIDLPFIVLNGDIISNLDFTALLEYFEQKQAMGVMCLTKQSFTNPYGVVELNDDNEFVKLTEKPVEWFYINSGIYCLSPAVLKYVPKDQFFDMPDLFINCRNDGKKMMVYPSNDFWMDIGNPNALEQANQLWSSGKLTFIKQ